MPPSSAGKICGEGDMAKKVSINIKDEISEKKNEAGVPYREVTVPILKTIGPFCIHREYSVAIKDTLHTNLFKLTHTATGYFILRGRSIPELEKCAKEF